MKTFKEFRYEKCYILHIEDGDCKGNIIRFSLWRSKMVLKDLCCVTKHLKMCGGMTKQFGSVVMPVPSTHTHPHIFQLSDFHMFHLSIKLFFIWTPTVWNVYWVNIILNKRIRNSLHFKSLSLKFSAFFRYVWYFFRRFFKKLFLYISQ